jgi:hypothetical protein
VLGHAEALLDAPQLVIGVDDELRRLADEVGGVALLISTSRDKKGYADGGVMPTGDGSCLVGVVPGLDCSA